MKKFPRPLLSLCLLATLSAACGSSENNSAQTGYYNQSNAASNANAAADAAYQKQQREAAERSRRLDALAEELVAVKTRRLTGRPYIRGKVLVVEKEEDGEPSVVTNPGGEFDTDKPGPDIYAEAPEHVGTLALLHYKKVEIPNVWYETTKGDTLLAFRWDCELTLIDRTIPAVVYKKTFRGKMPDEHVTVRSYEYEIVGELPDGMWKFLEGLPQQR